MDISKRIKSSTDISRYSISSIRVLMLAQEESRNAGHNFVGTEQLLLGLLVGESGKAAKALRDSGLNSHSAHTEVHKIIGRGLGQVSVEIPETPRLKRVFELAVASADRHGSKLIEPEHLLDGLLKEGEGVGARVLENCGVDAKHLQYLLNKYLYKPRPDFLSNPERMKEDLKEVFDWLDFYSDKAKEAGKKFEDSVTQVINVITTPPPLTVNEHRVLFTDPDGTWKEQPQPLLTVSELAARFNEINARLVRLESQNKRVVYPKGSLSTNKGESSGSIDITNVPTNITSTGSTVKTVGASTPSRVWKIEGFNLLEYKVLDKVIACGLICERVHLPLGPELLRNGDYFGSKLEAVDRMITVIQKQLGYFKSQAYKLQNT